MEIMPFPPQVVRVVSEITFGNTDSTLLSGETEQAGKYCHLCSKDMDMTVKQSSSPIMETNKCVFSRKERMDSKEQKWGTFRTGKALFQ